MTKTIRIHGSTKIEAYSRVRDEYVTTGLTDTEFADYLSRLLGVECSVAVVRNARMAFNIPSKASVTKAQSDERRRAKTLAKLEKAKSKIATSDPTIIERLERIEKVLKEYGL